MSKAPVRMFPVLWPTNPLEILAVKAAGCPRQIPWVLLAAHKKQVEYNHGQFLAVLASRGGLAPSELVAVLEDRRWRPMGDTEAVERLLELLAAGESAVSDTVARKL